MIDFYLVTFEDKDGCCLVDPEICDTMLQVKDYILEMTEVNPGWKKKYVV